jgi:hypothetical protein
LMAGSWRTDWDMIIPGHFSDNPDTDLLFYGRASGTGEFYGTNGSFSLIGSNPDWRQDWTIIIPGHFSDSPYTDPLFYDASTGTGDFWRTGGHGNVSQIGVSNTNWNRDWNSGSFLRWPLHRSAPARASSGEPMGKATSRWSPATRTGGRAGTSSLRWRAIASHLLQANTLGPASVGLFHSLRRVHDATCDVRHRSR